jgi:hypothetical protein
MPGVMTLFGELSVAISGQAVGEIQSDKLDG